MDLRGGFVLGLGVLCVGSAAILFRLAEAPALVKALWRLTLAGAILAPIAWSRAASELRGLSRADWRRALLAGLALGLHFGLWVPSLDYTSVASSVVLVTTSPLFVGLLSARWLGEPASRRLLAGIALAFAGAVVILLADASGLAGAPTLPSALLGDLLALGGAMAAAIYFMIGRRLRAHMSLLAYIFVVYSAAAACLWIVVLLAGLPLFDYAPQTWLVFVALAILPQLLGHSSFNWALQRLSAAFVSGTVLGEPVVSALLAWWILSERPSGGVLLGGGIVLAGLALASLAEGPGARHRAAPPSVGHHRA